MIRSITYTALPDIPMVGLGDDLVGIVADGVARAGIGVSGGDIFVVAHKIVSKAESRYVYLNDVTRLPQALELAAIVEKDPRHIEVVLSKSSEVVRRGRT